MQKNFTGLVMYQPKTEYNFGSLLRTAHILGINFFASIGQRYQKQASDTGGAVFKIPYFKYTTFEEFNMSRPACPLVAVELTPDAVLEHEFAHPKSAIYMLGAEDNGIPEAVLQKCQHVIKLRGKASMNVACAGSIVLYNRINYLESRRNNGD